MLYLKEHRNAKGMTLPQISQLTGIPQRTLEDIQRRGDCLVSNALKISEALGITINDLCKPPQ